MLTRKTKSKTSWPVVEIVPGWGSSYFAIKRAGIAKEDYYVTFGKLHFRTEELKQRFEDAYHHRGKFDGTSD